MNQKQIRANCLLFLTALIWGFAFSAQRFGAQHMRPFYFNGIRFCLGSLSLVPLIVFRRTKKIAVQSTKKQLIVAGILCGICMFAGASLQQIGIETTTAGKAGFVTGLYVVLVPLINLFLGKKAGIRIWIAVLIAVIGLYLLTVSENFLIVKGDLIVLVGSLFWAFHILTIDYYSQKTDPIELACFQFAVCSVLSLVFAFFTEIISINAVSGTLVPILYGGLCSVGIAYTLQVVAQKDAKPTQASLILCLETVFSVLGGMLLLNEKMTVRMWCGCFMMFAAIIIAQLPQQQKKA